MNKKFVSLLILTAIMATSSGCARDALFTSYARESGHPDVVLKAFPIKVKVMEPGDSVDAIQGSPEGPRFTEAMVLFRIEEELYGEFTRIRAGGPSLIEQAREAAGESNLLKLLTMDFRDPDEIVPKGWIAVAVKNPKETFGIEDWKKPAPLRYKLYLQRIEDRPDSYILTDSEIMR